MTTAIHLLNGSAIGRAAVDLTASRLSREFRYPVETSPLQVNLQDSFDPSRGQCLSTGILKQLLDVYGDRGSPEDKILGLVDVDLFIPVLTFVFGEAQLGGRVGLVSTFRLRNQLYGLPTNDAILGERVAKESIHEAGHLFGLVHCREFDCVMRSSTYMEEIDLKQFMLCHACSQRLAMLQASPTQEA